MNPTGLPDLSDRPRTLYNGQKVEIYEADSWNGNPSGTVDDSKLPPGLFDGSQLEVRMKCTKDAIQFYLNDYLQFSSNTLHSNGVPDLHTIELRKDQSHDNPSGSMTLEYGKEILNTYSKINTYFLNYFSAQEWCD